MRAAAGLRIGLAVAAVAAVLAVATVATPPAAASDAPDDAGVTRLVADDPAIGDPVAAALAVTRRAYDDGSAREVLLGRADVFGDTLAAGSATGRPVLLTPGSHLADATAAELRRLGAESVTVLGGTAALDTSVEAELAAHGYEVRRLWGETRVDTALAIAEHFHPDVDAPVVIARAFGNGTQAFADALGGAALAHAVGGPILLTPTGHLPDDLADYLARAEAAEAIIAGGEAAVSADVEAELADLGLATRRAAGATRTGTAVAQNLARGLAHSADAPEVLLLDGGHEHAWAAGLPAGAWAARTGTAIALADGDQLDADTGAFLAHAPATRLVCAPGAAATVCEAASRALRLPPFAAAGGLELRQPSTGVELIGYHEANHPGAQQLDPAAGAPASVTMDSRGRGTPSRSAADIVVDPRAPVRSPVSGEVVRAGTYQLYCRYTDEFAVIEPDGHDDREVKLLHIEGLRVAPGDRVEAAGTIVADRSRTLPFRSQVDRLSGPADWPHVHLEVVDTSVPAPPSSGC